MGNEELMREISIKKAALINGVSKYTVIFFNILFSAILSRILSPKDYGIVAIVGVFLAFFNILSDMGLGTAVIQYKEITYTEINHIYTFTFYISFLLAAIFMLLSFPISFFYSSDVYFSICAILSISLFFNTFNMIPNAVLMREKRFLLVGIRLIVINIATFGITIFLALHGLKYYALVIQSVLSAVFIWIWNYKSVNLKIIKKIDFDILKKIKNYSGYHFVFSIINYFARNLDKIIIGKLLGDIPLAQYDKAYKMMLYPIQNLTHVITPVLHPILSDYQNNKEYIYDKYLKILKLLSLLGFFITVVCFWCSREIIILTFGNQWYEAGNAFRWLSLSIWAQMTTSSSGVIFQSIGNTKLMFQAGAIAACSTIFFIFTGIIFSKGNLAFVSGFISIGFCLSFFINYFLLIKQGFKKSFVKFLGSFFYEFIIFSICMFFGYLFLCNINFSLIISLVLKIFFIGIIFSFITCFFYKEKVKGKILVPLNRKIDCFKSGILQYYYSLKKNKWALNTEKREYHLVVSLTSYPARFKTLFLGIKSIFNQTIKPDVILLFLSQEEVVSEKNLPDSILNLKQYGLQIKIVPDNIKSHKKYLYAIKLFPKSIIITIDDDCFYDKNLIKQLYKSYLRYPNAVSARRVHKIKFDKENKLYPYNEWIMEYKNERKPSFELIATGCGGILYPPGFLPEETFDINKIKELCLNQDDIWLKFMELKNDTPVVWVKSNHINPVQIKNTQKTALVTLNIKGDNDICIRKLQDYYQMSLVDSCIRK